MIGGAAPALFPMRLMDLLSAGENPNLAGVSDADARAPEEEVEVHFVRVFSGDSVGFWIL